jgi:membrane associated rhomboid family serine protease
LVRRHPFTFGLLVLLIGIFAVEIAESPPSFWLLGHGPLPDIAIRGVVWTPAVEAGEWWRLLTAGFLHGSLVHLALNAYALVVIGSAAEYRLGTWRTAVVFLGAVVGGNIAAGLIDQAVPSLGASGGVMGLAAAVVLVAYRTKEGLERQEWVIAAIVGTIFYGFLHAGISNSAHIGGLLVGAAIAWSIGVSAEYAQKTKKAYASRQKEIESTAQRAASMAIPPDEDTSKGVVLRPSWSFGGIAVMGLLLFGSPLVIDFFHPGAPPALLIACGLFVLASIGMLASLPGISLRLTDDGFVYHPPFWRAAIRVPWKAVLDVSVYGVSTGPSTQTFAKVTYVAQGHDGPKERSVLLNRLGNLKAARLVTTIEEYRRRAS